MTMKFRLTQPKFAGALAKFRDEISLNFRENKGRNVVTKTWNDLKPPKTIYDHLQPPQKIQQPSTTTSKTSTTTRKQSKTI